MVVVCGRCYGQRCHSAAYKSTTEVVGSGDSWKDMSEPLGRMGSGDGGWEWSRGGSGSRILGGNGSAVVMV